MLRQLLAILFLAAASAAVTAEPAALSSQVLNETVAGAVIELDTPIGTKIPMRFGTNGLVTGEAGVLAAFLGAAKDRGRWWVANNQLCIKWFRWFQSEQRCMEIRVDGPRIFWRQDDGDTGTATLTERATTVAAAQPTPQADEPKPAEPQAAGAESAASDSTSMQPAGTAASAEPAALPTPPAQDTASAPKVASPVTTDTAPAMAQHETAVPSRLLPARPLSEARTSVAVGNSKQGGSQPAVSRPERPSGARRSALAEAAGSFRVARVDGDDMLNVRSGPSEHHKAVGIISARGRGVKILGACRQDWCPVRHGAVTGWVNRYYLAAE